MKVFAKSDIGRAREMNQDAFYASQPSDTVGLYIVADGMGGYNGGEIASSLAVTAAKNYIETNFAETEHTKEKLQELFKEGLKELKNPFMKALFEKQSFSMKDKLNPTSVAFYMTPLCNAMIRSGTMPEKRRMYEAFIHGTELVPCNKRGCKGQMELLCIESARECTNAKAKQGRILDQAEALLEMKIVNHNLLDTS